MKLIRPLAGAALLAAGVAALYAVRPGVVENGLRSPRVWLVVVAVLLVGRGTSALLQRVTGRPRLARTAGLLVPAVATVALLAPSFQQRVLVEPFPVVAAAPLPTAEPLRVLASPSTPSRPAPAASPAPRVPVARPAPVAASAAPAPPEPTPPVPVAPVPTRKEAASSTQLLSSGPIEGIGHSARGTNALYATPRGTVLRFEDVDIEGTVEPVVYLVRLGARTPAGGVRLGPLKAERGSFGYTLPSGVDGTRPWTVLVWCAPYDTPISAADLPRP